MQTRKWGIKVAILFLSLGAASPCLGRIIYVDADAAGANDGSNWADAYNYLQDVLADANSLLKPVEIRVAQGTYKPDEDSLRPDGTGDREATFQLINGVTLKGGYAGFGEPDPNGRDIQFYETILSGDLNGDDVEIADACDLRNEPSRAENSYHVVTASVTYAAAVLDGFTITGGNASSLHYEDPNSRGGGVYGGYPVLLNCTLALNYASQGGGTSAGADFVDCMFVANSAGEGGAACGGYFINCTFIENSATGDGGAINGEGWLTGCTFRRNYAGRTGGVMYICDNGGIVTMKDCVLEENSAGESGGGVYVYQGDIDLIGCILRGNSAIEGGAVASQGSFCWLTDCSFTDNSASLSGGGIWGSGILRIAGCSFESNSAGVGGGIGAFGCDPILMSCTFAGNSARQGGGICSASSYSILNNCILHGNSALMGNALACDSFDGWDRSQIELRECILWDGGNGIWNNDGSEITISYSDIQGGWSGPGNIDADPCFANPGWWDPNGTPEDASDDFWVDGDYHLKSQAGRWDANEGRWTIDEVTSPCIDAGDPMSPIGLEPFPNGGIVNMGAYGGTGEASKSYFGGPPCETVVAGDINGDCAVDFKDFVLMALHWLGGR